MITKKKLKKKGQTAKPTKKPISSSEYTRHIIQSYGAILTLTNHINQMRNDGLPPSVTKRADDAVFELQRTYARLVYVARKAHPGIALTSVANTQYDLAVAAVGVQKDV